MCKHGDLVQMSIDGKVRDIDRCISHIVAALNAGGVKTIACCCGHKNEMLGNILLDDGRVLAVMKREAWSDWQRDTITVDIHGNKVNRKQQRRRV